MNNRHTRLVLLCSAIAVLNHAAPAIAQDYDLLPMLQVDRNALSERHFASPVGGYVRFWIERMQPPAGDGEVAEPNIRRYGQEARDPLERLLWGRNHSRVLQAKLVVTRSNTVSQSITLAAASHDSSGREGESWRSELGERRFLTPYLRVDQGTTAAIEVTLSASRETDSAVTRNILSIVQTGARLVAPTGPLVTALNSDRLNQTTNFIDNAISRLFREKVVETSQSDFPAERWIPQTYGQPAAGEPNQQPPRDIGRAIAAIRARFPMGGHVWSEGRARNLGEWRVYATNPIVSIFSTVSLYPDGPPGNDRVTAKCRAQSDSSGGSGNGNGAGNGNRTRNGNRSDRPVAVGNGGLEGQDLQACIAFSGLVPARVLGLPVGENVTLGQALRGDSGITAAVQRFQGDDKAQAAAAREVCNLVAERAETLGLNAYDAAAAVWAFAWNGGLNQTLANRIQQSDCATASLAARLQLNEIPDSAAQTPGTGPGRQEREGSGAQAGAPEAGAAPADPPQPPTP